ncbi:lacto-N-biosidase [Caudoviricetes sp.]|nr:lacto-N-biosidase [Caudoviricetes sp.]
MSLLQSPDGITAYAQGLLGQPSIPLTTGKVFYVNSVTGSNGRSGKSPAEALGTIDNAIGRCRANKGDTIFVMPGHTETLTAAAAIVCDIAGVSIIGLGVGNSRPLISFSTATTADIDIDAANVRIQNIRFDLTGINALAAPIDVNAAGFQLLGCEFELADASGQCTLALLTDANAVDMIIDGCYFFGSGDAGTATAIRIVGGDSVIIRNNVIVGAFTTTLGGIENNTTACTNLFIQNNYIDNRTASSTKAVVAVAGTTGMLSNNRFQILSGTAPVTAAGMSWVGGNYYAAAVATAGTLI